MLIGIDVAPALRSHATGTERYAHAIVRGLLADPRASALQWRLYAPRTFDARDFLATDAAAGLSSAVTVKALSPGRLWTHRRLGQEVAAAPPDVLFVPAHVLPFVLWPRRLPPSVVTIHDVGFRHLPDAHDPRHRFYLDWSTRHACRHATLLIAVSASTAADLVNFYGADSRRIRVVHEAATPTSIPSQTEVGRVRKRYALDRPYALYLGTIQPRKNLVRLIQAYAHLVMADAADFDLVLAGAPGWGSQTTLDEPARLGVAGRVHFPGYVAEEDRTALLGGASFFCYPSLYEGFGLPILEAQGAGTPVLTATNSSLPEVAGDAALLVDPTDVQALADAMLRLSRDEALRRHLIEAGHLNVKRFSWAKAARETLDVLEQAAARSPR